MSERTPGIRPRPSVWRQLDTAARHSFPAATTALLILATAIPFGLPDQAELLPAMALACVFFWSLFRPGGMSPPVVFLIGVLADLLGYAPLGVNVLTLLILHGLALRWRRVLIPLGFVPVWLAFAGLAVGAAALGWALTCVLTFRLLPPGPAGFQAVLSAALYPALSTLFTHAHRSLSGPGGWNDRIVS
jgi:rod shape-determining protein MreD